MSEKEVATSVPIGETSDHEEKYVVPKGIREWSSSRDHKSAGCSEASSAKICLNRQLADRALPVTALTYVELDNKRLLLCGVGDRLRFVSDQDGNLFSDCVVLDVQAVHGVKVLSKSTSEKVSRLDLLVCGGQQFVHVEAQLRIPDDGEVLEVCCNPGIIARAPDRIISAEVVDQTSVVVQTSYNELMHLRLDNKSGTWDVSSISAELRTFLYSGTIVVDNIRRYIVAAGTAFGEILTWVCYFDESTRSWQSRPFREFLGHKGSIFGVCISAPIDHMGKSKRLLASSSDDRQIFLWDLSGISDFNVVEQGPGTNTYTRCNEFLATVYGHASRIWNVTFVFNRFDTRPGEILSLISVGEDATIHAWSILDSSVPSNHDCLDTPKESKTLALRLDTVIRHHDGKNIWSHCFSTDFTKCFTGGADGRTISPRRYNLAFPSEEPCNASYEHDLQDIGKQFSGQHKTFPVKQFVILPGSKILAVTDRDALLGSALVHDFASKHWSCLYSSEKPNSLLLARSTCMSCAFLVDDHKRCALLFDLEADTLKMIEMNDNNWTGRTSFIGCTWVRSNEQTRPRAVYLVRTQYGSDVLNLFEIQIAPQSCAVALHVTLKIPVSFETSSAFVDHKNGVIFLGSRAGAVTIVSYKIDIEITGSPLVLRHAHGCDTVTHICTLENFDGCTDSGLELSEKGSHSRSDCHYLSTGRNGTYNVYRLSSSKGSPNLGLQLELVHRSTPSFGPFVEGAIITMDKDGEPRLLLYGFKSTDFVLWDETAHQELLTIACGGAHRGFDLYLDPLSSDTAMLAFTRAGKLNCNRLAIPSHVVLQNGTHGREIKALSMSQIGYFGECFFATGSEDTNIHISSLARLSNQSVDRPDRNFISTSPIINFRKRSVIRKHMTGIQHLQFTQAYSGGQTYLFSSGGAEELFAWKIQAVPVLGQGIMFAGWLYKPENELGDARIMHLDVQTHHLPSLGAELLVAAFSNGRAKVIRYHHALPGQDRGRFYVEKVFDFGEVCLTQAIFVTGDRDNEHDRRSDHVCVAATNGNLYHFNWRTATQPPLPIKVHQNAVHCIQYWRTGGRYDLVVTTGDDNALTFTLLDTQMNRVANSQEKVRSQSISIPSAHAAAVTSCHLVAVQPFAKPNHEAKLDGDFEQNELVGSGQQQKRCLIVTVSNDQFVKFWTVILDDSIDYSSPVVTTDMLHIDLAGSAYCSVADASNVRVIDVQQASTDEVDVGDGGSVVWRAPDAVQIAKSRLEEVLLEVKVMVVGVGIEISTGIVSWKNST